MKDTKCVSRFFLFFHHLFSLAICLVIFEFQLFTKNVLFPFLIFVLVFFRFDTVLYSSRGTRATYMSGVKRGEEDEDMKHMWGSRDRFAFHHET